MTEPASAVAVTDGVSQQTAFERSALPKVVGVMNGPPFDIHTWSGSSASLMAALSAQGLLHTAIDATPPKLVDLVHRIRNFDPDVQAWKFKYHIDTHHFDGLTTYARARLRRIPSDAYDAVLQVGAWFDLTRAAAVTVSYHDANLAMRLASPYGYPRRSSAHVRRALAYEVELARKMDCIFTMSSFLADSFVRDMAIPSAKIVPVGVGINLPRLADVSERSYERPEILFVGKGDFAGKGGFVLLEAFARVRKAIPAAHLTMIGPDHLGALPPGVTCEGFISRSEPGGLDRLLAHYARASLFVMPSLYEAFGIAFLEAMAHRLPCIGSDCCAMPEIIEDGVSGYIVPPGDSEALARKMIELLTDARACEVMGEQGFARYRRSYSWDAVAKKMGDSLRAML